MCIRDRIRGDRITRSLKRRLDSAYDYACINTECKIIVSGGQGRGENKTEALAMYEYLCERGIDSDRIIMEDKSTDTNENMKYSVQYISDFSSPVGIATNNFHIFRSKLLAKEMCIRDRYDTARDEVYKKRAARKGLIVKTTDNTDNSPVNNITSQDINNKRKEDNKMTKTMNIEGMMCGHCEARVKKRCV